MMGGKLQHALVALFGFAAITAGASSADAQQWPNKPIRWLVPVAAGGATDVVARLLQEPVAKRLGTSIIVENRPGGAGIIATQAAVMAAPDGYTMTLIFTSHAVNPAMQPKLPYDLSKDITPIAFFWRAQLAVSVLVENLDQVARGPDRRRPQRPGPPRLWHRRARHRRAPSRSPADGRRQHQAYPCSVSRGRAGVERSAGRPGADPGQQRLGAANAHRGRAGAAARRHRRATLGGSALRADSGRARLSELRSDRVERAHRPSQLAGRGRAPHECHHQRSDPAAGSGGAIPQDGAGDDFDEFPANSGLSSIPRPRSSPS